jgi:hypothetical protein
LIEIENVPSLLIDKNVSSQQPTLVEDLVYFSERSYCLWRWLTFFGCAKSISSSKDA